jgi:uncharacterized membrane protein
MIPEKFHGLPLHPLVVHAPVVLIPLALLLALLYALPRTRAWAAIPMVLVSVAAFIATYLARESGFNFKNQLGITGARINNHQHQANILFYMMIVFALIAIAVFVVYRRRTRTSAMVQHVAAAVLVVAAAVVAYQVAVTGEAGARVVYGSIAAP